jgi:hypothetical protein
MPELWTCILNSSSANYETWHRIFGEDRVPLQSSRPVRAQLGSETDVEAYMLNLNAMTLRQRANLLSSLAQKFKCPISEIEAELQQRGFPIRAVDVVVSYDMRAFV